MGMTLFSLQNKHSFNWCDMQYIKKYVDIRIFWMFKKGSYWMDRLIDGYFFDWLSHCLKLDHCTVLWCNPILATCRHKIICGCLFSSSKNNVRIGLLSIIYPTNKLITNICNIWSHHVSAFGQEDYYFFVFQSCLAPQSW